MEHIFLGLGVPFSYTLFSVIQIKMTNFVVVTFQLFFCKLV